VNGKGKTGRKSSKRKGKIGTLRAPGSSEDVDIACGFLVPGKRRSVDRWLCQLNVSLQGAREGSGGGDGVMCMFAGIGNKRKIEKTSQSKTIVYWPGRRRPAMCLIQCEGKPVYERRGTRNQKVTSYSIGSTCPKEPSQREVRNPRQFSLPEGGETLF